MCQKWEGDCGLWVLNEIIFKRYAESLKIAQPIQPNLGEKGLDWLCYLAGNSQTAPTNFFQTFSIYFKDDFIKNPQTTIALPFLTHNISAIGGVLSLAHIKFILIATCMLFLESL